MTDSATFKLAKARWPFATIGVGQSFYVTNKPLADVIQACENATRLLPGRLYVVQARKANEDAYYPDAGVRVWRTV